VAAPRLGPCALQTPLVPGWPPQVEKARRRRPCKKQPQTQKTIKLAHHQFPRKEQSCRVPHSWGRHRPRPVRARWCDDDNVCLRSGIRVGARLETGRAVTGCSPSCGALWMISHGGGGSVFFHHKLSTSTSYSLTPKGISDITVCGVDHTSCLVQSVIRDAEVDSSAHHRPSSFFPLCEDVSWPIATLLPNSFTYMSEYVEVACCGYKECFRLFDDYYNFLSR
jgi:hypothetical protein